MTLATRCPACSTVFRVVPDQLRVSEGWVRCGRCTEVFNATQHLVDATTGQPRRSPIEMHGGLAGAADRNDEDALAPGRSAAAASPAFDEVAPARDERGAAGGTAGAGPVGQLGQLGHADPSAVDDEGLSATPASPPGTSDAASAPHADSPGSRDAGFNGDFVASRDAVPSGDASADDETLAASARPATPSAAQPSFLRRAEQAARWQRPGVRLATLAGCVGLAVLLAAQAAVVFRDAAVARWPGLGPTITALCAPLGCRVEPLRAIDALVVDSSGLVRADGEPPDVYRLAIALRNQRAHDVAMPAIDLSLTDTQGRLIARRVLRASELGAGGPTVRAQGELALQATLRVAAAPVAGYTIELFYP